MAKRKKTAAKREHPIVKKIKKHKEELFSLTNFLCVCETVWLRLQHVVGGAPEGARGFAGLAQNHTNVGWDWMDFAYLTLVGIFGILLIRSLFLLVKKWTSKKKAAAQTA